MTDWCCVHELQQALRRLAARLFPGRLCDGVDNGAGGVKVEDMVLLVDTMLEEMSPPDEKVGATTGFLRVQSNVLLH